MMLRSQPCAMTEGIAKYSDTDSKHYHFYETYKKATDLVSKPAATCDYDETIDLLTLVTGCATNAEGAKAREINKAALAVAGLEFRFAVPTVPFKRGENEADNQKYIKLNGSVATPLPRKEPRITRQPSVKPRCTRRIVGCKTQ